MPNQTATTTVEVEIYGGTYKVRGGDDSQHLQDLAGLVDDKMREIATQTETVDTTKIAILAALNFADELSGYRNGRDASRSDLKDRVDGLSGQLEDALEG